MRHGLDATFDGQVFRKDHPMVIVRNRHLASIIPSRLAYNADGYKAGQVIALDTDDTWKKWSLVSGTATVVGVLFEDIAALASSGTALARGIMAGEVDKAQLIDYNAQAKTAMLAKEFPANGVTVVKF